MIKGKNYHRIKRIEETKSSILIIINDYCCRKVFNLFNPINLQTLNIFLEIFFGNINSLC